jgi:lysine-arginine-ornithine-binding protein
MKRVVLLCVAALAASPFAGWAANPQVIRFGVDSTFPPFESKAPDGSYIGFDIDLGNAICEDLHAKCQWVEQSFDGMIPALKARKFDAILSSMTATESRQQQIDFTDKIWAGPSRLVGRKGSTLKPTAESLRGKRVGVDQGSVQESYAREHWAAQGVEIVPYQNQEQIYQDLAMDRIDVAFQGAAQAQIVFLDMPRGKDFAFVGGEIKDKKLVGNGIAIGIRKGDTALESQLNQAIRDIRKNGTYDRIARKYFDFNIYGD